MIILGSIILVVGIVLFFFQRHYGAKLQSIRSATASNVNGLRQIAEGVAQEIGKGSLQEYVKIHGEVVCDRPIYSQITQEPCVYYTMSVEREYEEEVTKQDSEGKTVRETERRSETISQNQNSTAFILRDETGDIWVEPNQAGVETVQILDEFRPETGSYGQISFGNFSFSLGAGHSGSRTIGYRYRESILPIGRRVLVVGTATDEDGILTIRKPKDGKQKFMISLKTEQELIRATNRVSQGTFYGMLFCFALGSVLIIADLVK